jgi:hypothetical protein
MDSHGKYFIADRRPCSQATAGAGECHKIQTVNGLLADQECAEQIVGNAFILKMREKTEFTKWLEQWMAKVDHSRLLFTPFRCRE